MKIFIMISLLTVSLPLDASRAKNPKSHSNPHSAVVYSRLATKEPASDETSPTQYSPSEVALREVSSATARVPSVASAEIKMAQEKSLVIPAALVSQITENIHLETLIHKKIAELYPKIPARLFDSVYMEGELKYQREQSESQKKGQAIALSPNTRFQIEAYNSCMPFFNASSKELIKSKLKAQDPSLSEDQIEAKMPEILKLVIHQKMQEISRKFMRTPFYREKDIQKDYEGLLNAHKGISALPDPRDKQLLDETIAIVLEDPALTPQDKNSCCTIL